MTMVDQLWMWVLPENGDATCTVITAFPQRSNRHATERKKRKVVTLLMTNILAASRERPVKSAYQLAEAITSECSRIYLDTSPSRKPCLHFLDIYQNAIYKIVRRALS
jgi:hypothetical protein